jgi:U3 small nucleolar RNA-associated protein 22
VFRLKIMYDKDPTRVMATKIDKQLGTIPTDEDLLLRSTHSSLLQGLHNVYPAYGLCVQFAKQWIWSLICRCSERGSY